MRRINWRLAAICGSLLFIMALVVWSFTAPGTEREIGSYVTSLHGRTPAQIHNVTLATRSINNIVLLPGQRFSFVKSVGTWTADRGYLKAPVSYDGELISDWGGGVCQASSTLYNAALLAGLKIVERHRHHWPARYAPPGRDAAVAYENIDLSFVNTLPEPVRIVGSMQGDGLVYKIMSRYKPKVKVRIEQELRSVIRPSDVLQDWTTNGRGRWKLINRGHPGFYVVTYRRFTGPDGSHRELVSEDRYPAMNRIVRVAER
ncbi:MAG: VanW family protein [Armatimonadota bacterium]|nr:VanW family protein [bacterium]